MDFKNSLNINILIMTISIFAILSIGSIVAIQMNNNNTNIALAQSTAKGNTTTSSSKNMTTVNTQQQQQQPFTSSSPSNITSSTGLISSVQTNASGKPTWVLSGQWILTIPHPLKINQTNPPTAADFNAGFGMIKIDGTSIHTHTISNFKLLGSYINGNDLILRGTATVSMKDGPVNDVPITITILNQGLLTLLVDPIKTNNHFGDSPIYGTVNSISLFLSFK